MTHSQELIVAEARRWIGTPYRHQHSHLGAGCDCLGLLRGIWRRMYGEEPESIPAYSADWSEPQAEERLLKAARRHLHEIDRKTAAPGDLLLFRMRPKAVAKHLGIQVQIGARSSFIHAYSGHGVVESPLSLPWHRRIAARFQFPEGAN